MKNRLLLVVSIVSVLGAVSVVSAVDKGPEKITINGQKTHPDISKKKDKKKVANFPHHKHQDSVKGKQSVSKFKFSDDWTCGACHHKTKKGDTPVACLSCKEVQKMLDHGKIKGKVEKIYHNSCRDACHKKTDKKMAKCDVCHKKKK